MLLASLMILISISMVYLIGLTKFYDSHDIIADNGVLDLRTLDLSENNPINLDGVWEFYPNEYIVNFDESKKYIPFVIPNSWKNKGMQNSENNALGYGTFHIRILMHPNQINESLGLKINSIRMSHKIFINGEEISGEGIVGTGISNYQPRNKSYSIIFPNHTEEIDIVVWVSNYHDSVLGGIIEPICLGTQSQITIMQENFIMIETLFISATLILGAFCLIMFLLNRHNISFLYLSIFGLSTMILFLVNGEDLIYRIIPSLSYSNYKRLGSITDLVSMLFLVMYIESVLPVSLKNIVTKTIKSLLTCFIIFTLFMTSYAYNLITYYALWGYLFIITYILYGIAGAVFRRHSEALILGISAMALMVSVLTFLPILDFAGYYNRYVNMVTILMFILAQAVLISKRQKEEYHIAELMSQDLIQAERLRSEFIIKASHELKSPLSAMSNLLALIKEDEKKCLSLGSLRKLQFVIDSTLRLNRVFSRIDDIARIKVDEDKLNSKEIEVNKLLVDIVSVYGFIYAELKCNINLKIPDERIFIKVDAEKLTYIVLSIFDSALLNLCAGDIDVTLLHKNNYMELVVSVSSNNTLCSDFKNISTDEFTSDFGVMGMGLTKKIVSKIGGNIKFNSNKKKFKEIRLNLPLEYTLGRGSKPSVVSQVAIEDEKDIAIKSNYVQSKIKGTRTVMIIDDDKKYLDFLFELISRDEYNVVTQLRSNDSKNVINDYSQIDLVVINLVLANESSLNICKAIREKFSLIELPILILTSPVSEKFISLAMMAGANDIIQKPIHQDEIKVRITSLLELKSVGELRQRYEIAFLNAQIKPHFLFNALNTLVNYCDTDPGKASELIISLAKFLRGTLAFSNTEELISLEREVDIVKAYLKIECSRFTNLKVNYHMEEIAELFIPPLTIQILVENIIKHVIKSSTRDYVITISIKNDEKNTEVSIKDNGEGTNEKIISDMLKYPKKDGSIGIYNVNARLIKLCNSKLEYITSENGTVAFFKIKRG